MTKDQIYAIRLVVAHKLGYSNQYAKHAQKFLRTGKLHPQLLVHINIESVFAAQWVKKNMLTQKARELSESYIQEIRNREESQKPRQLFLPFINQKQITI